MPNSKLSPREEEIVDLSLDGFTNEAIAHKLGIRLGTVNTYWLRIKLKVGGQGKADTVGRVIKQRTEAALREAKFAQSGMAATLAERETEIVELRAALALYQLAMDQIKSTVWATDLDLKLYLVANGEFPSSYFGSSWEIGKSVEEIFTSERSAELAIAAHRDAVEGQESYVRLTDEFANVSLRVMPLREDSDAVVGCVAIVSIVGQ